MGKGGHHFLGGFEVKFVRGKTHPARIIHGLARLDAKENLVGLGVHTIQIMAIICRDQGKSKVAGQAQKSPVRPLLFRQGVFLKLQKVTSGEDIGILLGRGPCVIHPAALAKGSHLPFQTGGQGNKAGGIFTQNLFIDAGTVIETLLIAYGNKPAQVPVSLEILAQQDKMARGIANTPCLLGKTGFRRQVHLATNQGFYTSGLALQIELDGAEHVAMVGKGNSRHPVLASLLYQIADADCAVQEGILCVDMKMNKIRDFHIARGYNDGSLNCARLPVDKSQFGESMS
jgi:hypothetical protein